MANNVVFSISTQMEMEGRQLKAVKPNKDGVYTGIPLAVIGCDSRNRVSYERESVLKCLTDVESRFAANVTTGDMEGEWGHPFLSGQSLERLLHIERTRVSHYFTRVYGKDVGGGIIMVYGDVKPFGPYGQYLRDSFEDASRNTSFSLRSAAKVVGNRNGITQKRMLALVTFDAVDGPGFIKASKRFRDEEAATESLAGHVADDLAGEYNVDIEVSKPEFLKSQESLKMAGQESIITDQRILDAFGCDKITIRDKVVSRVGRRFYDETGKDICLFDQCFGA